MKKVLFVCVENSCRSQMAKGFFNASAKQAIADSAGTQPAQKINPGAIEVMKEKGIDISTSIPKTITPEMNEKFDIIVTMGCIQSCPITPGDKTIEWKIDDPKGKDIAFFRQVRDQINEKVKKLIKEVI